MTFILSFRPDSGNYIPSVARLMFSRSAGIMLYFDTDEDTLSEAGEGDDDADGAAPGLAGLPPPI